MTPRGMRFMSSLRVPIRDEAGKPRYILGIMEDVTERKQQEDELRRTRTFLDTIIENMPAMLTVKDAAELRYVLVNRAAEQFFGLRSEDMIGKRGSDIFTRAVHRTRRGARPRGHPVRRAAHRRGTAGRDAQRHAPDLAPRRS